MRALFRHLPVLAIVLLALITVSPVAASTQPAPAHTWSPVVTMRGPDLYANGARVHLQGVVLSALEYACVDWTGEYSQYAGLAMWDVNTVKIPVNPHFWTGTHCSASAYQAVVTHAIDYALAQHTYVLVGLMDYTIGSGGDPMPRADDVTTLHALVSRYGDRIMYEPEGEPHDVSWNEWRYGDAAAGEVGAQTLATDLNSWDSQALDFALTPNWGGTPGFITSNGGLLTGRNIGYSAHIYDAGHNANPALWLSTFANLAQHVPVIAGEFGGSGSGTCGASFLKLLMPYMAAHIQGWYAWEWNPDSSDYCGRPALLVDARASLVTGQASVYGAPIKAWYTRHTSPPVPVPTATPPPICGVAQEPPHG